MALFPKGDPAKKLASEIEALRRELDNVVARRKSDDASLPGLADAVSRLLREAAPDRDLEAAEAKLNTVEKRIVVCTKTEVEVQEQIAAKEKELGAIHDGRLREQTDVQIEDVKKSVETDGADFQRAADKFATTLAKAANIVLAAHQVRAFLMTAAAETPAATAMVLSELKNYQIAVKDKRAPAVLHTQDPQLVPPPPPPTASVQNVFLIQDVKWTDASKQMRLQRAFTMCSLPVEKAHLALKIGAACSVDDERVKRYRGASAPGHPSPTATSTKDLDGEPSNAPPILHSAFEPHPDQRQPYKVSTPRNDLDKIAANNRSADDIEKS